MLDRLSIRAKLTASFAAAMVLVLALAAVFTYVRVESDLYENLDEELERRAGEQHRQAHDYDPTKLDKGGSVAILGSRGGEEDFAATVLGYRSPDNVVDFFASIVGRKTAEAALTESVYVTRGSEPYRYLARPVTTGRAEGIVVVGTATEDLEETLDGLRWTFLLGAPLALAIACGLGYLLAGRALAPVETMRKRASEITLEQSGERLPLPRADDEIHELGATLNTMLDRIEASLEREREFVADAGHELRTPLAILRAELELAERDGRSPDELRAAIASAAEETDRLSQLAEDLLVIARSDQGRLPIKRERVELGELLERVRKRFAQRAADAGRRLSIDSPDGARADLDPLRMEQALSNLVDNALRHGSGAVEMTARAEDGRVAFEVRDQGQGFPDDFSGRAFERFSRADEGRTGGGAGLGLAIVQAIVKAHGGDARIDGAGVVITLPA